MTAPGRLIEGDCVTEMSKMPGGSVDLIVTSPPYDGLRDYNGYSFDAGATADAMHRVLKPGGVAVWVVADQTVRGGRTLTSFRQAITFQDAGFTVFDVMIYQKRNTPFTHPNRYTNCFEYMFVFSRGRPATFNPLMDEIVKRKRATEWLARRGPDGKNKYHTKKTSAPGTLCRRVNIWKYSTGLNGLTTDRIAYEHPALFPEKLAEDHILSWSNPGDLVLDPFCGSGTTLKMAQIHGRRWVGIDVSAEYLGIAKRRTEAAAAQGRLVVP